MKISAAAFLSITAGLACSAIAANDIRISEVYGGGGATSGTPTFNADYIELFNAGTVAHTLTGHSLQYSSAAGTTAWTVHALPTITINPGQHFLVQVSEPGGTTVGPAISPAPDLRPSTQTPAPTQLFMSATNGRVALVSDITAIVGANTGGATTIVDLVGYGSANFFEGAGAAPVLTNQLAATRALAGATDTDNNAADFSALAPSPQNSGFQDCNGNSIDDATEILANPSLDCDHNGALDSCQLTSNPALDCNGNGTLDSCDIAANPGLDCNTDGLIDSCEILTYADFDGGSCGTANGVIDSCETPGPGQDCNANGKKDCWDFKTFLLTDVNNNGVADVCEGAAVIECAINATVQGAGVRAATGGTDGYNIEGTVAGGTSFASYGALRWNNADIAAALPPGFSVDKAYLFLQHWNAGFTNGGIPGLDPDNIEFFYTNSDGVNITPGNTTTQFANFATDFPDRQSIKTSMFVESSSPSVPALPGAGTAAGSGVTESILLYNASGTNTAGADALRSDVQAGTGQLTLLMNIANLQDAVAATYAGRTHALYRGPTLVIFPGTGPTCDSIDFNGDTLFPDTGDIDDFLSVFSGGPCSNDPNCGDIDFNNDGLFPDTLDIDALLSVFSGGPCLI